MVVRKCLPLSQRRYLAIKETYNERNQLHFTKESSREEKEKTRGTDNARFHSGRNPTRHRCSPSRAKKSCRTSATLSQPFTIRSRETYRFHGSDPFTKEAWSMHFSPRRLATVCVCVFVSSIVLFVTYRFTYDRISCVGGRTSAYRVPRKSAPLSSMLFPFRPLQVSQRRNKETSLCRCGKQQRGMC